MAEILATGVSHYPPLSGLDDNMAFPLRWTLDDPLLPDEQRDAARWPEAMRSEWGEDGGAAAAGDHRRQLVAGFATVRKAIDDFAPDAIVIWGDDQYENFREDLIPPFAVLAYEDLEVQPWAHAEDSSAMKGKANIWGEGPDTTFKVKGRPDIAKHLVSGLLERDIDVSYAYRPLHHKSLPHAFLNAILYLDYDRNGFEHPIIPFPLNCYGRRVVSYRGFLSRFGDIRELDPPSPSPSRFMEVGAAAARVLADSPWRVALVASASWSHAFLCDKTWRMRPDTDSDRGLYDLMVKGDYAGWRGRTLAEIEEAGEQEMLNWFALMGAVEELGLSLSWSTFVETHVFNSNKVFATFESRTR